MTEAHDPSWIDPDWSVGWEVITPETAQELLDGQAANRKPSSWKRIAEDIRNGRWECGGGGAVLIDDTNRMIDGQNRMIAIVETGTPVALVVVRGVPARVQDVVDTNDPRWLRNQFQIHGVPNASAAAATLRMRVQVGRWVADDFSNMGAYTVRRGLDDYALLAHVNEVVAGAKRVGSKSPGKLPAAIIGGIWLVLLDNGSDPDVVSAFFERYHDFNTGRALPDDPFDPVWMLREMVSQKRLEAAKGASPSQQWMAAITIKAWNLYREEATVKLLKWTSTGRAPEKFPVPAS